MRFDVDYYNEEHRELLRSTPDASKFERLVEQGLDVNEGEFLGHMMFTEQKNRSGYRTYRQLRDRLPGRVKEFRDYFSFGPESINARYTPQETGNHRIERVGVSAALLAANEAYGLTEADWEKIPVSQVADLDFSHQRHETDIASDGLRFIEVEAKASIDDDTGALSELSDKKKSIELKKVAQRERGNVNVLLGAITAIPRKRGKAARIRLLDPPPQSTEPANERARLLRRLYYYRRLISTVSRLHMLTSLSTRVSAIQSLSTIDRLSGVPLSDWRGEPYEGRAWSFVNKAIIEDRIVGRIIPLQGLDVVFHGFMISVLDTISGQRFQEIIKLKTEREQVRLRGEQILMGKDDAGKLDLPVDSMGKGDDKTVWVRVEGDVDVAPSGRAFGILNIRM